MTEELQQRTEAWFLARLGIPSASNFNKLITPDGKKSKQASSYVNELISEIILGQPTNRFVTEAMQEGIFREEEAKDYYSYLTNQVVKDGGFFLHRTLKCGASPDGLIGEDGLLEIKCPNPSTMIEYFRTPEKMPKKYIPQVQGQLMVLDRKWVDFMAYHSGMKPLIVRVFRDEEFIENLANEVKKASMEIDKLLKKLKI